MANINQSVCPFCFGKEMYSLDSVLWFCLECKIKIKEGKIIKRNIKFPKELRNALK